MDISFFPSLLSTQPSLLFDFICPTISDYASICLSIYVCTNLFIYHTLFLSPFSYFSNLSIFLPVSRSFLLSIFLFLSLFLPFLTLSLFLSLSLSLPLSRPDAFSFLFQWRCDGLDCKTHVINCIGLHDTNQSEESSMA